MPKILTGLPDDVAALYSVAQGFLTASAAQAAGVSNDRLRRLAAAGLLTTVGHGCYAVTAGYQRLPPWDRHRVQARAFSVMCRDSYLTGWSAVATWLLPTIGKPPPRPSALWPKLPGRGSSTTSRGRFTVAGLPAEHRWRLGDTLLVSKGWAAADVARKAPVAHSMVVADAAVRMGVDLTDPLGHMRRWPGVTRARWVAEHADPGAESALESLGRFSCIESLLPMPISNAWVGRDGPTFRVDGLWPWHWAASEGDGAIKYNNRPDAADIVVAQNEREWQLRRLGVDLARYDWDLAARRRDQLGARFAALLRDNPVRSEPIRWWKNVPGVGPVEPEPADWPSPFPVARSLPVWWTGRDTL